MKRSQLTLAHISAVPLPHSCVFRQMTAPLGAVLSSPVKWGTREPERLWSEQRKHTSAGDHCRQLARQSPLFPAFEPVWVQAIPYMAIITEPSGHKGAPRLPGKLTLSGEVSGCSLRRQGTVVPPGCLRNNRSLLSPAQGPASLA